MAQSASLTEAATPIEAILAEADGLGLTAEQRRALELLALDLRAELVQLDSQRALLEVEARREQAKAGSPLAVSAARIRAIEEQRSARRLAEAEAVERARAVLTPEQETRLSGRLDPLTVPGTATAAADAVQRQIAQAIEGRFKDVRLLEVETAQAIAGRLLDWAKTFAFIVGIPLALAAAVLGWFGIRTYNDFAALIARTRSEVELLVSTAQTDIGSRLEAADRGAREIEATAATLQEEYAGLQARLAEVSELAREVEALAGKVERIEEQIGFKPSAALSPALKESLEDALARFRTYLTGLGYQPQAGRIEVFVDPEVQDNAYYDGRKNQIVIAPAFAVDPDVIYRSYTHHALSTVREVDYGKRQLAAIESGLADYFPCSFKNHPRLGEKLVSVLRERRGAAGLDRPALRDLANERRFDELDAGAVSQDAGEVWGGAFWAMRALLGPERADRLLFEVWRQEELGAEPANSLWSRFAGAIVARVSAQSTADAEAVHALFEARGLTPSR